MLQRSEAEALKVAQAMQRESASNGELALWYESLQRLTRIAGLFKGYDVIAPEIPGTLDEIQAEIIRRQNAGEW